MPTPADDLAAAIEAEAADLGISVNVASAPVSQIQAPLILVRPDHPWMILAPESQPFSQYTEQYVALCVVAAGDPASGMAELRELGRLVREAAYGIGWAWRDTDGITPFDDGGVDYLGIIVSVSVSERE